MTWITTDKYAGHTGTVESNVYQRTVDYPDDLYNGLHIMLDTEVLVRVGSSGGSPLAPFPQ